MTERRPFLCPWPAWAECVAYLAGMRYLCSIAPPGVGGRNGTMGRRGTYLRRLAAVLTVAAALATGGCMKYGPIPQETFDYPLGDNPEGVFILCEGNFMYGNATMSFYLPSTGELQNEVFARANGMKLGDVAQSMTLHDGVGYVVVNNSGIIFGIDPETFLVRKVIRGIGSPRYMLFAADKAYVTSLYEPRIAVLDPATTQPVGAIDTGDHTSTEQMVVVGNRLFVTCWSYDDTVLVIDTATDTIEAEIEVRPQPRQMALDAHGKLWVLTDGGAEGQTRQAPALYRIDPATLAVEREFVFRIGDSPKGLCVGVDGETVYFLNEDVWRMAADAEELPAQPYIRAHETIYYALGVDPHSGDLYLGDAIDYQQQGVVYRFSAEGVPLDTLRVGITPTAFCFR